MNNEDEGATSWSAIRDLEKASIKHRRYHLRHRAKCTCWDAAPGTSSSVELDGEPRVGLALSGGGIRSATFSLGLLRSLSNASLVHRIDYLSTVSGGGYAGTFFCSLFVPPELRGTFSREDFVAPRADDLPSDAPGVKLAKLLSCDPLGSPRGFKAISQLRQGGHYLAPNGTSDALFAAVIGIRNWFAVAITAGLALLAFFLFVNVCVTTIGLALVEASPSVPDTGLGRLHPWKVVLIALAFWPAACAWAYWFARSGNVPRRRLNRMVSVQSVVAALIFLLAYIWPTSREGWHIMLKGAIMVVSALAIATYAAAEFLSARRDRREGADEAEARVDFVSEEDRVRDMLSRWLLAGIAFLLAAAALAVIHWASWQDIGKKGKRILEAVSWMDVGVATAAIILAIPAGRWLLSREEGAAALRRGKAVERRRLRQLASLVLGIALLSAFLLFWATMASGATKWIQLNPGKAWYNLAERASWIVDLANIGILAPLGLKPQSLPAANLLVALLAFKVALVAYLIGNIDSLLNRSSFSAFYSSRLRTAYLGATNRHRQRAVEKSVDQDDIRDEINLAGYYHPQVLAPIHLINVTINETTSRTSRVVQRDRKGKSMTVAPAGYIYPPGGPGGDVSLIPRGRAEDLPLSSWMAISGAAFTTGAGHHTSLGTAMLASLTNLRLGYWWWSNADQLKWRIRRPSRTVQAYLARELRASFDGTHPDRWYLSDGGHYENTGVYELVRRRIPFIIASDNGADRFYEFADLVNLIRKIRIDFGAEVEFLNKDQLNAALGPSGPLRDAFGTLDQIRASGKEENAAEASGEDPKAGPYATLAWIEYKNDKPATRSTLLLIKPRITGRELPDLIQYRNANAAFPQQPTTNQFFDEAQWESYFRLGQLIGDQIFERRPARAGAWTPGDLEPLTYFEPPIPRGRDLTAGGA